VGVIVMGSGIEGALRVRSTCCGLLGAPRHGVGGTDML
jgi:hypothetical protein